MQDKKNQEVQTYKITKQLGSTHIQDKYFLVVLLSRMCVPPSCFVILYVCTS